MKKILIYTLVLTLCISSTACSSLRFPGVYRLKVMQGNYIEQKMIDKLEKGMSKRQVRYVMGTPLTQDTFNPDRWDYYFNVRHGDKKLSEFHFTVFFEDDKLARWEGDYEPNLKSLKEDHKEALEKTRKAEDAKFKKNDERKF